MNGGGSDVTVDGRPIRLTNLDRVLWPGFTKRDLVSYYRTVVPAILPHLRGRPVTLARFPEGVDGDSWYQTNCRGHPSWMSTYSVPGQKGGDLRYCVVDDEASLVWVANQGTIELHPLPYRASEPEVPTHVVFDLDPGRPAGIAEACRVALTLRAELADRGRSAAPKTTGHKGVHVYVPSGSGETFGRTKALAREIAEVLAKRLPDLVVSVQARARREGRVLVDWAQNDPNRSTIAPYSLRGRKSLSVSAPLSWEEGEAATRDPETVRFSPRDVLDRLASVGDLFRGLDDG